MKIEEINICTNELTFRVQFFDSGRIRSLIIYTVGGWLFQLVNNQYNTAGLSSRLNINLLYGYNLNPLHKFYGINCNTQINELGKDKTFNKKGSLCTIVLE